MKNIPHYPVSSGWISDYKKKFQNDKAALIQKYTQKQLQNQQNQDNSPSGGKVQYFKKDNPDIPKIFQKNEVNKPISKLNTSDEFVKQTVEQKDLKKASPKDDFEKLLPSFEETDDSMDEQYHDIYNPDLSLSYLYYEEDEPMIVKDGILQDQPQNQDISFSNDDCTNIQINKLLEDFDNIGVSNESNQTNLIKNKFIITKKDNPTHKLSKSNLEKSLDHNRFKIKFSKIEQPSPQLDFKSRPLGFKPLKSYLQFM